MCSFVSGDNTQTCQVWRVHNRVADLRAFFAINHSVFHNLAVIFQKTIICHTGNAEYWPDVVCFLGLGEDSSLLRPTKEKSRVS